ncbi:hypothetical protein VB737_03385 [Synechococcus sp. BA-120 BA3]|nr:hypothetical protein [Synechococcus sp. BA-120 BA3]
MGSAPVPPFCRLLALDARHHLTMALPGISNANEFYSAHYLESVLAGDIKKVRERWAEEANDVTPFIGPG